MIVEFLEKIWKELEAIKTWFAGKKTYIVAFIYALCKLLEQVFNVQIPQAIYDWLALAGVITVSAKINRNKNNPI